MPFNERKYMECLVKCRLADDIKVLPGGDGCEIGERGVNLSGGQKQRISLARALYADNDIVLIDDSLSALDAHVAKSVLDEVILGEFKRKGRTVVLATHALAALEHADEIVLIEKGQILSKGNFAFIKEDSSFKDYCMTQERAATVDGPAEKKPEVDKSIKNIEVNQDKKDQEQTASDLEKKQHKALDFETEMKEIAVILKQKEDSDKKDSISKLTQKESKQAGKVKFAVYMRYVKAFGPCMFVLTVILFATLLGTRNFSDYWIGSWSVNRFSLEANQYRQIYIAMAIFMFVVVILRSICLSRGMSMVGINLNGKMMETIFRRPISFFESTPIGVIINRCTKELLDLDIIFNNFLQHMFYNTTLFISIVLVISITVPFMIPVFIIVILMCRRYVNVIMLVMSDLKRVTQIASAPMISNVSELFSGQSTVRAYGKMQYLKEKYASNIQLMLNSDMHERFLESWIFCRIEFQAVLIVFATTMLCFMIKVIPIAGLNNVSNLSLAISWALITGDMIGFTLYCLVEVSKGMNSVERMLELSDSTDLEPSLFNRQPPKDWPSKAQIQIDNVKMKYRPNLPLVLKGVSLNVDSQEKIGIVGRTGSGKSSLILALMRIIEIEGATPIRDPIISKSNKSKHKSQIE